MLQTVLGFQAQQIARAFAVPPAAMAQRLVRAKRRILNTRIPFELPGRAEMPARLGAVLEAIYGAYAIDAWLVSGATTRDSLAGEALYLAVLLAELMDGEPEVLGLAALLSFLVSRAEARLSADRFVPLEDQDPRRWNRDLIRQGERYLRRAHAPGRIGRFQLEAAIQSVHADRPRAGLEELDRIQGPAVRRFQPAWATRAHLLAESGRLDEARKAFDKAISLTTESPLREYLEKRRAGLGSVRS